MPMTRPFACSAIVLAVLGSWLAVRAQQPTPEVCDRAGDMAALIACARKREPDRTARCASPAPASMSWPAKGEVVQPFGVQTTHGGTSKGLVLAIHTDAAVKSPVAGIVVFAGDFRSYGRIVIIDACTHDVLLAGLSRIDLLAGQPVTAGQPIGAMAKSSGDPPVLYIEVRSDGRPVDPAPLLAPR